MVKNVIKFSLGAVGIGALGFAAIFVIDYLKQRDDPELASVQRELEDLKKQMEDDPYGGSTPEETLQLFIAALKDGDTDLAAKYFVYEEQEQWKIDLAKMKEKGLLEDLIKDIDNRRKGKSEDEFRVARFFLIDENGQSSPLVLVNQHNKWKIRTF